MKTITSIEVIGDSTDAKFTNESYDIRVSNQFVIAARVGITMTEVSIVDLQKMTLRETYVHHVGTFEEICVSNITSIMIVNEVTEC